MAVGTCDQIVYEKRLGLPWSKQDLQFKNSSFRRLVRVETGASQ